MTFHVFSSAGTQLWGEFQRSASRTPHALLIRCFLWREIQEDYFRHGLVFHLTKLTTCVDAKKFLWLGTYYYHKNKRSPWRALMFLPHLQNVWFKKIHRKPCETATDFAFLYSLQLECISLGVCFLFIWIAHPLSMNSIKGRWEGEQCQQDNGTQHSSPFLSDSLICWLNITIASSPLLLDGSLNKN